MQHYNVRNVKHWVWMSVCPAAWMHLDDPWSMTKLRVVYRGCKMAGWKSCYHLLIVSLAVLLSSVLVSVYLKYITDSFTLRIPVILFASFVARIWRLSITNKQCLLESDFLHNVLNSHCKKLLVANFRHLEHPAHQLRIKHLLSSFGN